MRNVCSDCETNIIPKLHPSLRESVTCNHVLSAMTGEELNAMFPALKRVAKQIVELGYQHIAMAKVAQSNG